MWGTKKKVPQGAGGVLSASDSAGLVMRHASFLCVLLIGISPGRVSYHDQVQVQALKGKRGGKILEEALLRVLGDIRAKVLVMSASSGAYS